ncbi:NusG domain II-containing protein [Thiohalobacter thiocyanaticus]|uniref:NusG domain II-containing protein n=1 Tax=Thiohalobacter thiocyanaticus TaxID=585455 RepID=A0A426QKH6_9GAMM|nr:NusG domain II-containing protein [Thiohalobacter thiocyanaticus]RRQ22197.1 NusG domain II-containing protein [Thiohalobacter thiocyanaticus]
MNTGIRAGDFLVAGLALVLVGWSYVHFWHSEPAASLEVWVDGARHASLPLIESRTLAIEGVLGASRIELAPGRARFLASPCESKRCVHTGWIDQGGMVAACLPNRVSLHVQGRDRRYDAINL